MFKNDSGKTVYSLWIGGIVQVADSPDGPFTKVEGFTYPGGNPAPIFHKMFEGLGPELRHEIVFGRMQNFFNMTGPDTRQIATLDEIAEDGAGRRRDHASFE